MPRARIREAFSALEQRGLVERIPNRGAVVTRLDLSQVFHIYDLREVLEGLCARLATQNGRRPSAGRTSSSSSRGRCRSTSTRATSTPYIARLRALPAQHHRGRGQSRARGDARQHLREDAGPDPPHHHPAGPRRGRPAAAPRGARGDVRAAMPTAPSGCAARTCAAPRPISSASRNTSSEPRAARGQRRR